MISPIACMRICLSRIIVLIDDILRVDVLDFIFLEYPIAIKAYATTSENRVMKLAIRDVAVIRIFAGLVTANVVKTRL